MEDQTNLRQGPSKLEELGKNTVESLTTTLHDLKKSAAKLTAEKEAFYDKLVKIDELCKNNRYSHPLIPQIVAITSDNVEQKTKEKPVSKVRKYMAKHFGRRK